MNTTLIVGWEVFQQKFLNKAQIYVDDSIDFWVFYANVDGVIIKTIKYKSENPEENMMFTNALADRQNIVRIIGVEKEESNIETTPEPETQEFDAAPSPDGDTDA